MIAAQRCVQYTVKEGIRFTGVGLHTGIPSSVEIKPAPPNTGIVFHNVDCGSYIEGVWSSVFSTSYRTSLQSAYHQRGRFKEESWTLHTVEHLLAAISGSGVENAYVGVAGPEIPIMDGSAQTYAEALLSMRQSIASDRPFPRVEVRERLRAEEEGGRWAELAPLRCSDPDDDLHISVTTDYGTKFPSQEFSFWRSDFVSGGTHRARTFGFLEDAPAMERHGLARGADLKNAVILDKGRVLNPEGFRFPDELVRHKVRNAFRRGQLPLMAWTPSRSDLALGFLLLLRGCPLFC